MSPGTIMVRRNVSFLLNIGNIFNWDDILRTSNPDDDKPRIKFGILSIRYIECIELPTKIVENNIVKEYRYKECKI